jgi:hypothetical protein
MDSWCTRSSPIPGGEFACAWVLRGVGILKVLRRVFPGGIAYDCFRSDGLAGCVAKP